MFGWRFQCDDEHIQNSGGPVCDEASFYPFRSMARDCRIKEIPSSGDKLPWVGAREVITNGVKENVWIQCRLDRAFGNAEWFGIFPRSHTHYLERLGSDHMPILTTVMGNGTKHVGRFMFDKRWSKKPEMMELVRKGWNSHQSNNTSSVTERIASCHKALSKWKRTEVSNSKKMIEKLRV